MPHAVIETNLPLYKVRDCGVFFSKKGNLFIAPRESLCDDFIIRAYQKDDKVIVKLDKTTYPLVTDDVKSVILDFAKRLSEQLKGRIVHHNLTPTNKDCRILKQYLISVKNLRGKSLNEITNASRLQAEIGMGKGEFLARQARLNPDVAFIGFEVANEPLAKAALRFSRERLNNVFLINYDARFVLDLFKPNTVEKVFINFPEPWFKFRRLKHSLLNLNAVRKIEKILKKGGTIELLTDNLAYAISVATACEMCKALKQRQKRCIEVFRNNIDTYYERRWKRKNRTIYSVVYEKTEDSKKIDFRTLSFPLKIKRNYVLENGIIFKILDFFENGANERIVEVTFGESTNPQHAYFGLTKNNELFFMPQTVCTLDEEAKTALLLAAR